MNKEVVINTNLFSEAEYFKQLNQINCLNNIGKKTDSLIQLLALCIEHQHKQGIADINYEIGLIKKETKNYKEAIANFNNATEYFTKLGNTTSYLKCLKEKADIYTLLSDFVSALEIYLEYLSVAKTIDNPLELAWIHNRIGFIHQNTREYDTSIEYLSSSLDLYKKCGTIPQIISALFALGNVYNWAEKLVEAEKYLKESEVLGLSSNDESTLLSPYSSLAILYTKLNKLDVSLDYFIKGLEIANHTNNKRVKVSLLKSLGNLRIQRGELDLAEPVLKEALVLCEELNFDAVAYLTHQFLSDMYEQKGDFANALIHHKAYHEIDKRLLLNNAEIKTTGLQLKFDIDEAEKEKEIYKLKNIELQSAHTQISQQKSDIENIHREITDSIRYAKKIQQAILPEQEIFTEYFNESFILFKPRDIVSGDFYWFTKIKNAYGEFKIFAAVDCTGHGVPGAFMSMIGNDALNQIINENKIHQPGLILKLLDEKIRNLLKQDSEIHNNRDGMDIALCCINTQTLETIFAAASRPLIYIQNGEINELKSSKLSVGGLNLGFEKVFEEQKLMLQKGDKLYLFSDGYADQFGGPNQKKYMGRQLFEKIKSIGPLPMQEQKNELLQEHLNWKNNAEQVDDILVIGVEL